MGGIYVVAREVYCACVVCGEANQIGLSKTDAICVIKLLGVTTHKNYMHAAQYRGFKVKSLKVTMLFLILMFSSFSYAEKYKISGLYEITAPNDWLLLPREDIAKLKNDAFKIAKDNNMNADVELKDISVPLFIYKEKNDGVYSVRIVVGPAELTKQEFENLTKSEIKNLSNEISKKQIESFKTAKYSVFSSESGLGALKGIPGIRTEIVYRNSKGLKVSRAQYTIYRGSATLLVILEHIALIGEPNYKTIENQISDYKILMP